jgi:hypothetical protein
MKNYHYIPAVNESEFGKIAKHCDPVLQERRRIAAMSDIVQKRNALLRELSDLRSKPRRTLEEDKRMAELTEQAKTMMREIGSLAKK